jgi:hypothetical protein
MVDAGHGSVDEAPAVAQTPDPCGSPPSPPPDLRVEIDPVRKGFAPRDVLVSGGDTRVALFQLGGSGEERDTSSCSAVVVDGGAGTSEVRVECKDGTQSKSANVRLSGTRLDADIVQDGMPSHRSEDVKACARLAAGDLTIREDVTVSESGAPSPGRACADASATRAVDGFLRRGKGEPKGTMPIFLDVPALHLHVTVGKPLADPPKADFYSCESSVVTKHGWAYVDCHVDETASFMRVIPLPGEVLIDRRGFGAWPRERVPIPCDVRLVLHNLPCEPYCAMSP